MGARLLRRVRGQGKDYLRLNRFDSRDISLVIDNGFLTGEKEYGHDGTIRIWKYDLNVRESDYIFSLVRELRIKQKELDPFGDMTQYLAISVLRDDCELEDHLNNVARSTQPIEFIYGDAGELYMSSISLITPPNVTFGQLWSVVERHYGDYNAARIIIRPAVGLGAGAREALEYVAKLATDEVATSLLEFALAAIWTRTTELRPVPRKIRQETLYAQIDRDMVTRQVVSRSRIQWWLGIEPSWSTKDVSMALALPPKLAANLLKQAGYVRSGWKRQWTKGNSERAQSRRAEWDRKSREGFRWSPLDLLK